MIHSHENEIEWTRKVYSSRNQHPTMSSEISNGTGYQAENTDETMESGSDYYSAEEGERQRMEVESAPHVPAFAIGNLDTSQVTFSFGVSMGTDHSQMAITPGLTVSKTFL